MCSGIQYRKVFPQVEEYRLFSAFDVIVVAASAGGISALIEFLAGLPSDFAAPIVVAQHLPSLRIFDSRLDRVLQRQAKLRVKWAEDGEVPVPGTVYVAPQDKVTFIKDDGSLRTFPTSHVRGKTPRADCLFRSAAALFGRRALAVVLSGILSDGAEGSLRIAQAGGTVLVQSHKSSEFSDMPRAAAETCRIGLPFDSSVLSRIVCALVMAPGAVDWFRVSEKKMFEYHPGSSTSAART